MQWYSSQHSPYCCSSQELAFKSNAGISASVSKYIIIDNISINATWTVLDITWTQCQNRLFWRCHQDHILAFAAVTTLGHSLQRVWCQLQGKNLRRSPPALHWLKAGILTVRMMCRVSATNVANQKCTLHVRGRCSASNKGRTLQNTCGVILLGHQSLISCRSARPMNAYLLNKDTTLLVLASELCSGLLSPQSLVCTQESQAFPEHCVAWWRILLSYCVMHDDGKSLCTSAPQTHSNCLSNKAFCMIVYRDQHARWMLRVSNSESLWVQRMLDSNRASTPALCSAEPACIPRGTAAQAVAGPSLDQLTAITAALTALQSSMTTVLVATDSDTASPHNSTVAADAETALEAS